MTLRTVSSQAPKGIVSKFNYLAKQIFGGFQGRGTVQQGGIISNALTGITPRANPAESMLDRNDQIGPRRRKPLGPRRKGYGRGLGGPVRNVMNPRP